MRTSQKRTRTFTHRGERDREDLCSVSHCSIFDLIHFPMFVTFEQAENSQMSLVEHVSVHWSLSLPGFSPHLTRSPVDANYYLLLKRDELNCNEWAPNHFDYFSWSSYFLLFTPMITIKMLIDNVLSSAACTIIRIIHQYTSPLSRLILISYRPEQTCSFLSTRPKELSM